MKKAKCYNCKHAGRPFKISGKTHMHCQHPKYKEEDFISGKISSWDTLKEFWQTCEDHELKTTNNSVDRIAECSTCDNRCHIRSGNSAVCGKCGVPMSITQDQ